MQQLITLSLFMALVFSSLPVSAHDAHFGSVAHLMRETRKSWRAPGMAVAIVSDAKIIWHGADGYEDLESKRKASTKTVWRIASLSKPISATAIMQLVESDKVKLSDPVWKYLPTFPRKHDNIITIKNLLTHTSGIRHYRNNEKLNQHHFDSVEAGMHIYDYDKEPLLFSPGSDYVYSTYAYALLAGVIEKVTSLQFGDYLKEHIFTPAGMQSAQLDRADSIIPHRSAHYRFDYYGNLINAPYVDVSYKWAAGGLLANIDDLARYVIALDQGKLLSQASLNKVYTPYQLTNGRSTGYGLGWHVEKDKQGQVWVYHAGGATGGAAFIYRQPAKGFAVVIACNLERPGDLKQFAQQLSKLVLNKSGSA